MICIALRSFNLNTLLHNNSSSISTVPSALPTRSIIFISSSVTFGELLSLTKGFALLIINLTTGLKIKSTTLKGFAADNDIRVLYLSPIVLGIISDATIMLKVKTVDAKPSH